MKKINIMLHTEVIECLRKLDDETLASIMRMIFDWNDGIEVKPVSQVEIFAWALILPKLEKNKVEYQTKVKQTSEAAKKRWGIRTDTDASERMREDTNYNYNSSNNSSKEELLINTEQPSSPEGDSVVSKGLEKLESLFPQGKNVVGIDEINLWNGLNQEEKQHLIKKATLYVRNQMKTEDGKFIKKIGRWMKEEIDKGIDLKPKSVNTSTKSSDMRLLKNTDGAVYNLLMSRYGSTALADKAYFLLNRKDLFTTKQELIQYITDFTQKELNDLISQ